MNSAVAERPATEVAHAPQGSTTQDLMRLALQQGAGIEQMRELMQMQREHEAHEARKAFVHAMAAFKKDPPRVSKSKTVEFSGTKYSHATLADVCDAAIAKMSEYGLSHSWEVEQADGGITVRCVITHDQGHSERTSMTAPPDDSGKKNRIQQIASTTTYLERYTLMAALGMAARDMDDDGRAGEATTGDPISREMVQDIEERIEAYGIDRDKFVGWLRTAHHASEVQEIGHKSYFDVMGVILKRKPEQKEKSNG